MINILSRIKALHSDAKRYHWQCNGKDFASDHELFDRIAEVFNDDLIDSLVEVYYMGEHQEELTDLNDLNDLVINQESYKYEIDELLTSKDLNTSMFQELQQKIEELIPMISDKSYSQAVCSILDGFASEVSKILGLIKSRVARAKAEEKIISKIEGCL